MLKLESVNTDLSLSIEHDHEIAVFDKDVFESPTAKIHSTTMGAATATQRPAKTIAGTGNPHC